MGTPAENRIITAKYQAERKQLASKKDADLKALSVKLSDDTKALQSAHRQGANDVLNFWKLVVAETYDNENEEKSGPGSESGQR